MQQPCHEAVLRLRSARALDAHAIERPLDADDRLALPERLPQKQQRPSHPLRDGAVAYAPAIGVEPIAEAADGREPRRVEDFRDRRSRAAQASDHTAHTPCDARRLQHQGHWRLVRCSCRPVELEDLRRQRRGREVSGGVQAVRELGPPGTVQHRRDTGLNRRQAAVLLELLQSFQEQRRRCGRPARGGPQRLPAPSATPFVTRAPPADVLDPRRASAQHTQPVSAEVTKGPPGATERERRRNRPLRTANATAGSGRRTVVGDRLGTRAQAARPIETDIVAAALAETSRESHAEP